MIVLASCIPGLGHMIIGKFGVGILFLLGSAAILALTVIMELPPTYALVVVIGGAIDARERTKVRNRMRGYRE